MDQKDFEALMQQAGGAEQSQQPQPAAVTVDPEQLRAIGEQFGLSGSAQQESAEPQPEGQSAEDILRAGTAEQRAQMTEEVQGQSLSDLDNPVEAFAGGVAKSVFETKDFLFGDTPPEQQSAFRREAEKQTSELGKENLLNGFSAGIGQFAGAMVGLGKLTTVAKGLPWVGRALGFSKTLTETGKAATAGAIAFDPHEERLSNLVQGTPLANPVTAWLAADPKDSAAEGRLKSALESIGLDAVLIGTFMGSAKIYKKLREGDTEGASRAVDEMQAEQAKVLEAENAEQANTPAPVSGQTDDATQAEAGPSQGQPTNAPEVGSEDLPKATPNEEIADGNPQPADPIAVRGADDGATPAAVPEGNPSVTEQAVPGQVADTPPQAAAEAAGELPPPGRPRVNLSVEDTGKILEQADADRAAIAKYGGWYQAVEAGHQFGKGEGINYRSLNTDADVDDLMARMVDAVEESRNRIKGGKVLTDEKANERLRNYAVAFGDDPAAVLGAIQQAGKMGADLTARMEAGYILAERVLRDTWRLHQLYKLGDFTQFGGAPAMRQEIAKRMSVAASLFTHADSLKANYARGMRRMAFFNDYSKLKDLDMDKAFDLLDATNGDPSAFRKLSNPGIWSQIGDYALYLRVNSMVSGPVTQLINVATNGYMLGARPFERMLGSVKGAALGDEPSRRILRESAAQYAYMGNAFTDGFFQAGKAFMRNDSVLAPHRTELYGSAQVVKSSGIPGTQGLGPEFFRKWDSTGNLLYNALSVATVPIGLPTRLLGTVDELVKQTVYRSKLMARAHVEAVGMAADAGLTGKAAKDFVKSHVKRRVDEGFDVAGRGTDAGALQEAQIATFQQDLLPKTAGKAIQSMTNNWRPASLLLPFVKTPTNVIRYGWKMTPGLNLLQAEYRDMLRGKMGREAQAQAVGQMSMGALFMGSVAYMASNGMITGAGPTDPKVKQELMATGWKPYAIVREREDGTKSYVSFGRFDPVAVPMGIVADLQDALYALGKDETPQEIEAAIAALGIALAKQFTSKSYLLGATQTMEFLMDPERTAGGVGGSMLASFIPYSAAMRQLNPDDYLREARTMTDKVLATIPGLSETVPARYDAFGQPIVTRNGLWSSSEDAILDTEMQRLAIESGRAPVRVNPTIDGVDLREVTLSTGKNAYEEYQRLSGRPTPRTKPLKDVVTKFIQSESYKRAPDGDSDVRGTKLWLLHGLMSKYRTVALKKLKADPVVREALLKDTVKVREAYRARRGGAVPAEGQSPLGRVMQAFGID